jgi:GT2 family glycosyltransferase
VPGPGLRVERPGRNLGFAGGVNLGVRLARHRHVLLLNPDAEAPGASVDRLSDTLQASGAAFAGGRLVFPDGRTQAGFTVRRLPTFGSLLADALFVDHVWPTNPATRHYLGADLPIEGEAPFEVEQPAAACLLVTREAFDQLGGMDEGFHPAWFEDVDLCARARAAGLRIVFDPRATFPHVGGSSLHTLGAGRFARIFHRNQARYVDRHLGRGVLVLLTPCWALGLALRATAAAFAGRHDDASELWRAVGDRVWGR